MGENINCIRKHQNYKLVVASKGTGLDTVPRKPEFVYTFVSRQKNAGQDHNLKLVNTVKNLAKFEHVGNGTIKSK
jgi:hypothetical protein